MASGVSAFEIGSYQPSGSVYSPGLLIIVQMLTENRFRKGSHFSEKVPRDLVAEKQDVFAEIVSRFSRT